MDRSDRLLTGAQAMAVILERAGISTAFAYAGTSELALCDSIAGTGAALVNGCGDKETVFLAAGANLLRPSRAMAVVHGARGLTNAAGAIADVRRNEVGVVCVVGLPSTRSAPFLPPHAETGLLEGVGSFAKWWHQVGPPPADGAPAEAGEARRFVDAVQRAITLARARPCGPTLIGLPQDAAEAAWIPERAITSPPEPSAAHGDGPSSRARHAAELVARSQRVLVLIDDYYLRYEDAGPALARFAALAGAAVLQVRYRRGPMLFERLSSRDVPSFLGWWTPESAWQRRLRASADLLVTLEDRNLYRRVVGDLPECRKLALSSHPERTRKNGYLGGDDRMVEGDVVEALGAMSDHLAGMVPAGRGPAWATDLVTEPPADPGLNEPARQSRTQIVRALGQAIATATAPVLVDDSQMFGGMVCDEYDHLPPGLRVVGDHGGFVGAGIGYATGLAVGNPDVDVLCLLGDHGFINGVQGLAVAGQQRPNITYLVCNNGGSVSLREQARATSLSRLAGGDSYLGRLDRARYAEVASSLGVPSRVVQLDPGSGAAFQENLARFRRFVAESLASAGPDLVELRLPSSDTFWAGIWRSHGLDEVPGAALTG
jgi:acetolactate synthase-1/2/3 large subunit